MRRKEREGECMCVSTVVRMNRCILRCSEKDKIEHTEYQEENTK